MAAVDVFVLASIVESFGLAILEAWAAGIPVVAHEIGGIPGFCTDRENSLLVEPDNEPQFIECMTELAADSGLRAALSSRAFKTAATRYDWPLVAAQMREIYARILKD